MDATDRHYLVATGHAEEAALVTSALEDLGPVRIFRAENGAQAREFVENINNGFVLAAWELPGLGGLRLAREIAAHARTRPWPVVLIVPEYAESEREMSRGVGVAAFLSRPLTREAVSARVRGVLRHRDRVAWPVPDLEEADRLAEAGHLDAALAGYDRTLTAGKRYMSQLYMDAAAILRRQDRTDAAIDHLERAMLADPGRFEAPLALGEVLLAANRPAEAARALNRAMRLRPANERVLRGLAEVQLMTDQNIQAEVSYRRLLTSHPQDPFLLNRLGMALRKQGKCRQAVEHYHFALEVAPGDENLHFNLGRCYFEIGETAKAAMALNEALNRNPEFDEARGLLARILGKS